MDSASPTMTARDILSMLADIERRSRDNLRHLPDMIDQPDIWQGLAFYLSGVTVVAPMSEISEMLTYPETISRVPGTRPWVVGLANVRGTLLPIMDLQMFLGGKPVPADKKSRVLVIKRNGLTTGVLVSGVIGMRHFHVSLGTDNIRVEGMPEAYMNKAFVNDDGIWPAFSMEALTADPAFRVAAA